MLPILTNIFLEAQPTPNSPKIPLLAQNTFLER